MKLNVLDVVSRHSCNNSMKILLPFQASNLVWLNNIVWLQMSCLKISKKKLLITIAKEYFINQKFLGVTLKKQKNMGYCKQQ